MYIRTIEACSLLDSSLPTAVRKWFVWDVNLAAYGCQVHIPHRD